MVTSQPALMGGGKIGRVNVSESLMRLRYDKSPEMLVIQDGETGCRAVDMSTTVNA
jgi:hypothetical protein